MNVSDAVTIWSLAALGWLVILTVRDLREAKANRDECKRIVMRRKLARVLERAKGER